MWCSRRRSGLLVSGEGHGLVRWKIGGWRAFVIDIAIADENGRHSMALHKIVSVLAFAIGKTS